MGHRLWAWHVMAGKIALSALLLALLVIQSTLAARSALSAYRTARGESLQLRGDNVAALEEFRAANRALPIEPERFRLEAAAARLTLGSAAAAPIYQRAAALAPNSPLLLLGMVENFVSLDRLEQAREVLARLADLVPDEWRVHYLSGQIAMKESRYQDAALFFERAAAADRYPQADVLFQRARALYALGDRETAKPLVDAAIAVHATMPEYRLLRGRILLDGGETDGARKDLGWAVRAFENRLTRGNTAAAAPLVESLEYLARAEFNAGRFDESRETYERLSERLSALELSALVQRIGRAMEAPSQAPPRFWGAILDLCVDAKRTEDFARLSEAAATQFAGAEPAELVPPRARALTAGGRAAEALALLATASEGRSKSPEAEFAAAEAVAALGRTTEARARYASLLARGDLSVNLRRKSLGALSALPAQ